MQYLKKELAVQSYCLRHFTPLGIPVAAKKLLETGMTYIGIGTPEKKEDFQSVIDQYADFGVTIADNFAPAFDGNEAVMRKGFEFSKLLGHNTMTCNFNLNKNIVQTFELAEKLAAEYDIRLAIHNHGCWHWLGSQTMLDFIFQNTSERIGLCLDTAWAQDANLNAVEAVKRWPKRIFSVHLKDFEYHKDKTHHDVVIGKGFIDLPGLMAALKAINFHGYMAIEYEGEPENPIPALIAGKEEVLKLI